MNDEVHKVISKCLANLGKELISEMVNSGTLTTLEKDNFLIKQGQYVKVLPIVIDGAIKVFSEEGETQFLLYYIYPGSTCIFSFAHLSGQQKINFSGTAEKKSQLLLVPLYKVRQWLIKYPAFSELMMSEYQRHYDDLLQTTKQIICYNLEERLYGYLKTRAKVMETDLLNISHQQIAADLGTSREVVSRLMKKLEKDGNVQQLNRKIRILNF